MSHLGHSFVDYYEQYSDWLRERVVRRYGAQAAEDILQDTWLRFMPYQSTTRIERPRALLLAIAANIFVDGYRKRQRHDRLLSHRLGPQVETPSQCEDLVAKEIILSLPQPLRDVFVLSRLGGLTNEQIAEHLGIRPKTVEWRMTKALAHCAAQFRR